MAKYTITCTLSDAQDTVMKAVSTAIGITVPELFQRFWDGYTNEGIQMDGAVWAQVRQWLVEKLNKEISESILTVKV